MGNGTETDLRGPTTAERVRTVLTRATAAQLVAGSGPPAECRVHHLLRDGTIALTVDSESSFATSVPAGPIALELLDHDPVAAGESVRALVWIRGQTRPAAASEVRHLLDTIAAMRPDPALLDVGYDDALVLLTVDSVVFADTAGAAPVDLAGVLAARPDPFSLIERAWVHHLERHHPDMIERLRLHLPPRTRRGRIRLIGLDRYGVLVKTEGADGDRDHRIEFFRPVADVDGLSRALRSLMAHPFTRGLRIRDGRTGGTI